MQRPITEPWAKLSRDKTQWHPLLHHCADVAACAHALLTRTTLGARLAAVGGVSNLDECQVQRLAVLAGLHDIGKVNRGFQARADEDGGGGPRVSHTSEVLYFFGGDASEDLKTRLAEALDWQQLVSWTDGDESAAQLLIAVICHHGRPLEVGKSSAYRREYWCERDGTDPFDQIASIVRAFQTAYPDAFAGTSLLPSLPPFQHALSGLVMLADWLGSDEQFFPFSTSLDSEIAFRRAADGAARAVAAVGLDTSGARTALGTQAPGFDRILPGEPRPGQRCVGAAAADTPGSLVILEAETGSGKTEAAVFRYLRLLHAGQVDGMYFALPTRTAAKQIHGRVTAAMARAFPDADRRPAVIQAVPGYIRMDDHTAQKLPDFRCRWDDGDVRLRERGWAAESPKRYLAGAVVVGTVDQALLSSLMRPHAHLRATALMRHLLVVDEVHASDAYMTRILEDVVARHVGCGGHAMMLSATLGGNARNRLLRAAGAPVDVQPSAEPRATPFPVVCEWRQEGGEPAYTPVDATTAAKDLEWDLKPWAGEVQCVVDAALREAAAGARVLVIRNTVRDALAMQRALEQAAVGRGAADLLLSADGLPFCHHSRFAREDRELLDGALEARLGAARPRSGGVVAVATQTVQQSLDLDADRMWTDLCPMDVLLQRAGRLHRRPDAPDRPAGFETARLTLLTPQERDLASTIDTREGAAWGSHGLGTVYSDLRTIEATWRLVEAHPRVRVPDDCRMLVETGADPGSLAALASELGGPWEQHERKVIGVELADAQQGRLNLVRRDVPFGDTDVLFPRNADVPTRLGLDDRILELPEPIRSPFGARVRFLPVPGHMAPGVPDDGVVSDVRRDGDGWTLQAGTTRFHYDRLGLNKAQESSQ